MKKKSLKCVNCGETFIPETEKEKAMNKDNAFCPYCDVVVNGEKDGTWLPSLKGDDLPKGFHKI